MKQRALRLVVLCLSLSACGNADGDPPVDSGLPDSTSDAVVSDTGPAPDGRVPSCGNGRVDPGEACDGDDLGGQGCESFGLIGTLACTEFCTLDQTDCGSSNCPAGRRDCGGTCVDLNASQSNCGACGVVCDDEAFCNAGTCECNAADEVVCGNECVPVSNENCGACGNDCSASGRCFDNGDGSYECRGVEFRNNEQGLLEAGVDGDWRGVCNDGFDSREGEVICRQFGSTYTTHFPNQDGPHNDHWLDDLACDGTEAGILACGDVVLGREDCTSADWVALVCGTPSADDIRTNNGRLLEVSVNGQWGAVCPWMFDEAAGAVACRQMGEEYLGHLLTFEDFDSYRLGRHQCEGSESSLVACPHVTFCNSSGVIGLECYDPDAPPPLRLTAENLLEIELFGEYRGVCSLSFDARDGEVACRQLGFDGYAGHRVVTGPSANYWFNGLYCSGDENSIAECPSGLDDRLDGQCAPGSGYWVALDCGASPSTGNVRIEGGLLEYFHGGEWRGVCDDDFDANDGRVACREMGLDYVSHTTAQMGPSSEFWIDDLECTGSEDTLAECPRNAFGSEDCFNFEWVRLNCE